MQLTKLAIRNKNALLQFLSELEKIELAAENMRMGIWESSTTEIVGKLHQVYFVLVMITFGSD